MVYLKGLHANSFREKNRISSQGTIASFPKFGYATAEEIYSSNIFTGDNVQQIKFNAVLPGQLRLSVALIWLFSIVNLRQRYYNISINVLLIALNAFFSFTKLDLTEYLLTIFPYDDTNAVLLKFDIICAIWRNFPWSQKVKYAHVSNDVSWPSMKGTLSSWLLFRFNVSKRESSETVGFI